MIANLKIHVNEVARTSFDESNPLRLQMEFTYMANSDKRALLECQGISTSDLADHKLVAACMISYYYDVYSDDVEWEDSDGVVDQKSHELIEQKAEWKKIMESTEAPVYPYREFEEEEGRLQVILERRPRFFSRDSSDK
jgi:hypothetical protein